jgi:hypothetical protein
LNTEEIARLKHEIGTRQVNVDKAFAMLDDFVRKHERGRDSLTGSARKEAEEKVVLLERLMEAMSRLNASYRDYVQVLEKEIGL